MHAKEDKLNFHPITPALLFKKTKQVLRKTGLIDIRALLTLGKYFEWKQKAAAKVLIPNA